MSKFPPLSDAQLLDVFRLVCSRETWESLKKENPKRPKFLTLKNAVGYSFQVWWVPCGSKYCKTCPHGPYPYARRRIAGKQIKRLLKDPYSKA
jgi:hypothetical protein